MFKIKRIILTISAMAIVISCGNKQETVVQNTVPELYINKPADMLDEDGFMKPYEHGQPVVLKVDVNDTEDKVINKNRIVWALMDREEEDGLELMKGDTLTLTILLPPGKHEIAAMYKDEGGLVGGDTVIITVKHPRPAQRSIKTHPDNKYIHQWDGYVNNGDGTVVHQATGFTWMIVDDGYDKTFAQALTYAKEMSDLTDKTWTVPTLEEWRTISDFYENGSHLLDAPFYNLKIGHKYWTRTKHAEKVNNRTLIKSIALDPIYRGSATTIRVSTSSHFIDDVNFVILVSKTTT